MEDKPSPPGPSETRLAAAWLKQRIKTWREAPTVEELNVMLRRLGRWRSRLLATWEWRARPTPWLVMRPKSA